MELKHFMNTNKKVNKFDRTWQNFCKTKLAFHCFWKRKLPEKTFSRRTCPTLFLTFWPRRHWQWSQSFDFTHKKESHFFLLWNPTCVLRLETFTVFRLKNGPWLLAADERGLDRKPLRDPRSRSRRCNAFSDSFGGPALPLPQYSHLLRAVAWRVNIRPRLAEKQIVPLRVLDAS